MNRADSTYFYLYYNQRVETRCYSIIRADGSFKECHL